MCDLIRNVISFRVWSCDTSTIDVGICEEIVNENQKTETMEMNEDVA